MLRFFKIGRAEAKLGLPFDPDDGGTFLQNVGEHLLDYTASYPRMINAVNVSN
jgi:hypothetical protein